MGELVSLAEAARDLPGRKGRPPSLVTVRSWATRGVLTPAGERVRLQCVRIGRRFYTKQCWLDEFVAGLTAASIVHAVKA